MKEKFYGNKIVVVCFLVMFAAYGSISSSAIFMPEFVTALNSTISKVAIIASTYGIGCVIGGLAANKVFDKLGLKYSALVGVLLIALHHFLYTIVPTVELLYIAAAIGGIGMTLGTMTFCASLIQLWFQSNAEKMIGYAFAGTGLGAAFWTMLAGYNIPAFGFRVAYWIQISLVLLLVVPALLFAVKLPGQECVHQEAQNDQGDGVQAGVDTHVLFKSPSFYIMMLGMVAVGFLNLNFESYTPTFWQENGVDVTSTALYLSVYYLLGSLLTAFAGIVAEKFGAKVYITYLTAVFILGVVMVLLWNGDHSMMYIALTILFMSASFALYSSVPGTITAEAYGNKNYTKICSLLTAGYSFGQLVGPLQFSLTLEQTNSYIISFYTLIAAGVVAVVCILLGLLFSPWKRKQA